MNSAEREYRPGTYFDNAYPPPDYGGDESGLIDPEIWRRASDSPSATERTAGTGGLNPVQSQQKQQR